MAARLGTYRYDWNRGCFLPLSWEPLDAAEREAPGLVEGLVEMVERLDPLECAVRYIAAELGPKGIRVHAISPGPLATRAASGIPEFDALLEKAQGKAPTRKLVTIEDVGLAVAFLAHEAAKASTGDTLYIDGGYHIID